MFRVQRETEKRTLLRAAMGLLVVILVAISTTVWLVMKIRKAQQVLQQIVELGVAKEIELLGTLPRELPWLFLLTMLVLAVLVASGAALLFVVRQYLKSQASLRQLKVLAWDILASVDQGVVTTDCEGRITSINPLGQDLLGLEFDAVGRSLDDICREGLPLAGMSGDVIKLNKSQYDCDFSLTRDGHHVQLRADCHVLRGTDDDVLGTVLHIRDVTERILIEERMRRMERFMGLGTLAAGLHHEIKNPLSSLSLHLQLLDEHLEDEADDETAETLGVLKTEVTRIAGVLESFRDYASVETLHQTATDLPALVRRIVDLIRPQAMQCGVQIQVSVAEACAAPVRVDAARLEQVLLNLVMNALDAMRDGGTMSLAVTARRQRIAIEVSDTGRGIPENVRARIFDPYFTTKSGGSGMGLAVSDKIIRQHGGQIDVDTGPSGSTFRILLPVEDD